MGGFQEGGFQIVECAEFSSRGNLLLQGNRGDQSIYLHHSGTLLENGLDRPKNRYGRYGFPSFYSISISTAGVDGATICL